MNLELKAYLAELSARDEEYNRVFYEKMGQISERLARINGGFNTTTVVDTTSDATDLVTASSGTDEVVIVSAGLAKPPTPAPSIVASPVVAPVAPIDTIAVVPASCSTEGAVVCRELAHDANGMVCTKLGPENNIGEHLALLESSSLPSWQSIQAQVPELLVVPSASTMPTFPVNIRDTSVIITCSTRGVPLTAEETLLSYSVPAVRSNGMVCTELAPDNDTNCMPASAVSLAIAGVLPAVSAPVIFAPTVQLQLLHNGSELFRPSSSRCISSAVPIHRPLPWPSFIVDHVAGNETRSLPWPTFREIKTMVSSRITSDNDNGERVPLHPPDLWSLSPGARSCFRLEVTITKQSTVKTVRLCNDDKEVTAYMLSDAVQRHDVVQWQPWPPPWGRWITQEGHMFRPRPLSSFEYNHEGVPSISLTVQLWLSSSSKPKSCAHSTGNKDRVSFHLLAHQYNLALFQWELTWQLEGDCLATSVAFQLFAGKYILAGVTELFLLMELWVSWAWSISISSNREEIPPPSRLIQFWLGPSATAKPSAHSSGSNHMQEKRVSDSAAGHMDHLLLQVDRADICQFHTQPGEYVFMWLQPKPPWLYILIEIDAEAEKRGVHLHGEEITSMSLMSFKLLSRRPYSELPLEICLYALHLPSSAMEAGLHSSNSTSIPLKQASRTPHDNKKTELCRVVRELLLLQTQAHGWIYQGVVLLHSLHPTLLSTHGANEDSIVTWKRYRVQVPWDPGGPTWCRWFSTYDDQASFQGGRLMPALGRHKELRSPWDPEGAATTSIQGAFDVMVLPHGINSKSGSHRATTATPTTTTNIDSNAIQAGSWWCRLGVKPHFKKGGMLGAYPTHTPTGLVSWATTWAWARLREASYKYRKGGSKQGIQRITATAAAAPSLPPRL